MNDEEQKRIEFFIKGSKFKQQWKSLCYEFYFFEKKHGDMYNRFAWLSFFGIILGIAYGMGTAAAIVTFPEGEWDEESFDYELFKVDSLLKNINHSGNLLIIETEWMKFDMTIHNNHEKDVAFKVYSRVSSSGDNTYSDKETIVFIPKGESKEVVKQVPIKNEGINNVSIIFVMYGVYEEGHNKGKLNSLDEIQSNSTSKSIRAFTYSDYIALHEQSVIYKLLWVVIAPFAAITIKHIRDLVEGR